MKRIDKQHWLLMWTLEAFSKKSKADLLEEIRRAKQQLEIARKTIDYFHKNQPNFECEMKTYFFDRFEKQLSEFIENGQKQVDGLKELLKKKGKK
jgi:hypothetical protein